MATTFPPITPAPEEPASTYQDLSRLEAASSSLADAQRTAAQTMDVGAGILTQLGTQREQLLSARSTMQGTNEQLAQSKQLIREMFRRATTKKILVWMLITGLIGAILLVLVSKFSR